MTDFQKRHLVAAVIMTVIIIWFMTWSIFLGLVGLIIALLIPVGLMGVLGVYALIFEVLKEYF